MEGARDLFVHLTASLYSGMRRVERAVSGIQRRTSDPELVKTLGELRAVSAEQAKRLEGVLVLLDRRPAKEGSPVIAGMLDEEAAVRRERPGKQVLDVVVAKTLGDVAEYSMQMLEAMIQLAEHAGISNSAPRIADALEASLKEHAKLRKGIRKIQLTLLGRVPPS